MSARAERGSASPSTHTEDLRIDPRVLAERGVRFVKVRSRSCCSAAWYRLGRPSSRSCRSIGPAGHRSRGDPDREEGAVVDLLDHDVRYGRAPIRAAAAGSAEVLSGRAPELEAAEKILAEAAAGRTLRPQQAA